jgi:flavin reductase (DIM6/NTAB) family NADH-FMN oxidoreductase RutF
MRPSKLHDMSEIAPQIETERPVDTPLVSELDARLFRDAMGRFVTGVAVVTTMIDGRPHGMTANSLTSVSLNPPLILICMGKDTRLASALAAGANFALNILSASQKSLARLFAGQTNTPICVVWSDLSGTPSLHEAATRLACVVEEVHPAGDHVIAIGQVKKVALNSEVAQPLLFYRGAFHEL